MAKAIDRLQLAPNMARQGTLTTSLRMNTLNENSAFETSIVLSGYLSKEGGARGGFKTWKRRFFTLTNDEHLYYFKNEEESKYGTVLLGVLPLRGAEIFDSKQFLSVMPKWNDSSKICYGCKKSFSFTFRKHHCRNCGNSFCGNCSSNSIDIPRLGYIEPVRVCENCFSILIKNRRTDLANNSKNLKIQAEMMTKIIDHPHLFLIKTSTRELWIEASTDQEKLMWVNALNESLQLSASNNEKNTENPTYEINFKSLSFISEVGKGAFGTVYKGSLWGTEVAIKQLSTESMTAKDCSDIQKETAILSQLRHPNMVLYIGACTKPPNVAIVTEWCDHGSLFDVIHSHSIPFDVRTIVNFAMGIAQGLNYIHSLPSRIIHRDLKSSNILLDRNYTVKVADFGLSQIKQHIISDQFQKNNPIERLSLERKFSRGSSAPVNGVVGTPEWMAPEVMEEIPYDEKVDVYSFGIVLSELVSRQIPFHDKYNINSYLDVVEAVLEDGAIPTIPRWCSSIFKPLIEVCLLRDPSLRPSFTDIILRLKELQGLDDNAILLDYDIPRLLELLNNSDPFLQEEAAREISSRCSQTFTSCPQCGFSPISFSQHLNENTAKEILNRLVALLSSASPYVIFDITNALKSLLENDPNFFKYFRESDCGALNAFFILVNRFTAPQEVTHLSSIEQNIRVALTGLLSFLIPHFEPTDFEGLDEKSLFLLASLLENDYSSLRESHRKTALDLDSRKSMMIVLKKKRDLLIKIEKDVKFHTKPLLLKPKRRHAPNKIFRFGDNHSSFATIKLEPVNLVSPDNLSPESAEITLKSLSSNILNACSLVNFIPPLPLKPDFYEFFESCHYLDALLLNDNSIWENIFLIISNNEIRLFSIDQEDPLDAIAIIYCPSTVFASSIITPVTEWMVSNLNDQSSPTNSPRPPRPTSPKPQLNPNPRLRIDPPPIPKRPSQSQPPSSPKIVIRSPKTPSAGHPNPQMRSPKRTSTLTKVSPLMVKRTPRDILAQRELLVMEDKSSCNSYTLCFSTPFELSWMLNVAGVSIDRDQSRFSLPLLDDVPEHFLEYYASCDMHGYLLVHTPDDPYPERYSPRYFFLLGTSMKYYRTHEDDPEDPLSIVYLSTTSGDKVITCGEPKCRVPTYLQCNNSKHDNCCFAIHDGEKSTYFCAQKPEIRQVWLNMLKQDQVLSNNPQDTIPATPTPNSLLDNSISSEEESASEDESKTSASDTNSPRLPLIKRFSSATRDTPIKASPDFIEIYGPPLHHGYLWKKGKSKVYQHWKKRYFYLTENQIRYFKNHEVKPEKLLGAFFTTTTDFQSKNYAYHVFKDENSQRPFAFIINTTDRGWKLCAATEIEMNEWFNKISEGANSYLLKQNNQQ